MTRDGRGLSTVYFSSSGPLARYISRACSAPGILSARSAKLETKTRALGISGVRWALNYRTSGEQVLDPGFGNAGFQKLSGGVSQFTCWLGILPNDRCPLERKG
jgi:hypothetical protein